MAAAASATATATTAAPVPSWSYRLRQALRDSALPFGGGLHALRELVAGYAARTCVYVWQPTRRYDLQLLCWPDAHDAVEQHAPPFVDAERTAALFDDTATAAATTASGGTDGAVRLVGVAEDDLVTLQSAAGDAAQPLSAAYVSGATGGQSHSATAVSGNDHAWAYDRATRRVYAVGGCEGDGDVRFDTIRWYDVGRGAPPATPPPDAYDTREIKAVVAPEQPSTVVSPLRTGWALHTVAGARLHTGLRHVTVCAHGGVLYALGGQWESAGAVVACRALHVSTATWHALPPLPVQPDLPGPDADDDDPATAVVALDAAAAAAAYAAAPPNTRLQYGLFCAAALVWRDRYLVVAGNCCGRYTGPCLVLDVAGVNAAANAAVNTTTVAGAASADAKGPASAAVAVAAASTAASAEDEAFAAAIGARSDAWTALGAYAPESALRRIRGRAALLVAPDQPRDTELWCVARTAVTASTADTDPALQHALRPRGVDVNTAAAVAGGSGGAGGAHAGAEEHGLWVERYHVSEKRWREYALLPCAKTKYAREAAVTAVCC